MSRFPASDIDLAFVVADDVAAAAVAATLEAASGGLLEDMWLFDVYRSDRLGADRRSLAFRLRCRATDHTLDDGELSSLRQACVDAVVTAHDGGLRS